MRFAKTLILLAALLGTERESSAQTLIPSSGQLQFGNVFENAPDSLPLTLTNPQAVTVTVTGMRFYPIYGAPAFSTSYSWFTIAPGGSATVWIRFSPVHNIYHNSELVIENDGHRGFVHVDLQGQGKYSNAYYNQTENQSEEALKAAINSITTNGYVSLLYNPARDSMFMWIDNKKLNGQGAAQNTIECIYTGREAVGYTDRTDCQNNYAFNTEHTFPQSLFSSMEPMKSDLHHLFPTDNAANNERGDNPFGIVTSPTWSNGGSLSDGFIFEPRDDQKGATARAMFYFVLRYQNYTNFLNSQESILRTWHHDFLPGVVEKQRNADIFTVQQNRNPFVDYPVLLDRITSVSSFSQMPLVQSIDLPEDSIIYGTVSAGTPVMYDYIIVNNGNTDLLLTSFNLSRPAELSFVNSGNDTVIGAGEALALHVQCLLPSADSLRGILSFNTNAPGQTFVSVPIFVNDPLVTELEELTSRVTVAPNPASQEVSVSGISSMHGEISLFDVLGRKVAVTKIENGRAWLDVGSLERGVYILYIQAEGKLSLAKKLIIE